MQFSFATAGHIVFGAGTVVQAGGEAAHMGHRALLVAQELIAENFIEPRLNPLLNLSRDIGAVRATSDYLFGLKWLFLRFFQV